MIAVFSTAFFTTAPSHEQHTHSSSLIRRHYRFTPQFPHTPYQQRPASATPNPTTPKPSYLSPNPLSNPHRSPIRQLHTLTLHQRSLFNIIPTTPLLDYTTTLHYTQPKRFKFYAIRFGRTNNIICRSWTECSPHVLGYPNAQYRSFTTHAEALAYLREITSTYPRR